MSERLKLFIPLVVFILLAVLFWVGLQLDTSERPVALLNRPVPAFELPTVHDSDVRITEQALQGKVSLLNVWGTWCVACHTEHPFLVKLAEEEGVPIYGVNYKDDVDEARQWLRDLHDPYVLSVVDADGRLGIDLGVYGAPETYLVDREGIIRYKHVGVVDDRVWSNTLGPKYRELKAQ